MFRRTTKIVIMAAVLCTAGAAMAQPDLPPPPPPQSLWDLDAHGMPQRVELWTGEKFRFDYDDLYRLRRVESFDRTFSRDLDEAGRRIAATSELGVARFHYDPFDRLAEIRFEPTGTREVHFVRYEYDIGNQIKHISVIGGDRRQRYSVGVNRDLLGRPSRITLGGQDVTFQYHDNQVIRQTPDGVRSTFTHDSQGLLSSIRHDDLHRGTLISQTTFDLDPHRQQITVGRDVPGQPMDFRTFDAGTRHLRHGTPADMPPVYGFEGRVEVGAAGLMMRDPTAGANRRFLRVPFDARGELVLEMNSHGEINRALVAGQYLAFEHHVGPDHKHFHLEQGYQAPYEVISHRTFHGAPPSGWNPGAWQSTLSHVDRQFGRSVELGGGLAGLGSAGLELEHHYGGPPPGSLGRTFDRLNMATNIYRDFMDFSTSTAPIGQSFREHILLGNTSESLIGGLIDDTHIGGFVAGQALGLGMDLARGKSWGNPDVIEHFVDTFFLGGAALFIARGNPKTAAEIASALQATASLGRFATQPAFEQTGTWWGRTSPSLQGQHVWQLATGALYGDPGRVQDLMGSLGDRTRLFRGRADRFEAEAKAINLNALADMLPAFRNELHRAGHSDGDIAQLELALRSRAIDMPSGNFSEIGDQLGGVEIEMKVDVVGDLGHIEGAVYDPASGTVTLVGDGAPDAPELDADFLAVALYCIFGPHGRGPTFSLDPEDPTKPDGDWQKAVYRPEYPLRDSRFGYLMWATDWAMKQAAFGTEVRYGPWFTSIEAARNHRGFFEVWSSGEIRSFTLVDHDRRYLGFDSLADVIFAHPEWMSEDGVRARQWIVVKDEKVTLRVKDGAFVFDPIELDVKARRQEKGADGKLRDVDVHEPASAEFARGYGHVLRTNLAALAEREPAFLELPELVRAVAFARWLRDQRVPIDLSWVEERLRQPRRAWTAQGRPQRDSVARVNRLMTQHVGPHGDWAITLSGGVSLDFRLEPRDDDGHAAALGREVRTGLESADAPILRLAGGRRAAVLPFTRQGRELAYRSASLEKDGVHYRLDEKGRVRSAVDVAGNEVSYEWNGKKLAAVSERTPAGWTTRRRESGGGTVPGGTVHEVRAPDGRRYEVARRSDGSMTMAVNGKVRVTGRPLTGDRYETREYEGDEVATTIEDAEGRVISYGREGGDAGPTGDLGFKYDGDGRLHRVVLDGKTALTLTWDSERLATMTLGNRRWVREERDGGGLRLRGPGGDFVEIGGDTEGVMNVTVRELGRTWRYVYRRGRLVSAVDPDGHRTAFVYDSKGRRVREEVEGRTRRAVRYDSRGRLAGMEVAGVSETRLEYADANAENPRRIVVRHLTTPGGR